MLYCTRAFIEGESLFLSIVSQEFMFDHYSSFIDLKFKIIFVKRYSRFVCDCLRQELTVSILNVDAEH